MSKKVGKTWFNKKMKECMGNMKGKSQTEIRKKFKSCAIKIKKTMTPKRRAKCKTYSF